ncbi:MAG: methyl-accepting chemotaxis protein [bacterium]|nr:methyl-accepting chemotaxis protein [bacterium]
MNETLHAKLKKFKYQFIFSTELISYFLLVPLLILYISTNINLSTEQLRLFTIILIVTLPISMTTTLLCDFIYLSPISAYFDKVIKKEPVTNDNFLKARRRFFQLPKIHGIGSFIRWIVGLAMVFAPLTILGDLTFIQKLNLWILVPVISPFGGILYFLLTEIFIQKLLDAGLFQNVSMSQIALKINFLTRIFTATFVMIGIPVIGIIGHFLLQMEASGFSTSFSYVKLLGIIIFGFSAALTLLLALSKTIKDKIKIILNHVDNMGLGKLDTDAAKIAVTDDLTEIYKRINIMRKNITEMIYDINKASHQLKISTDEISGITRSFANDTQDQAAIVEEVTASIEEISADINRVSQGTKDQRTSLQSLESTMVNLSETIEEMEKNIKNALSQTKLITGQAMTGEKLLKEMNASMNNIVANSQQMSNIVNIINDISDRINLLSLNASIEAARAGDSGRGFAVVAEEISKLADNTASSVSEIDALINTSEEEIQKELTIVNNVVDSITSIITGVDAIDSIVNRISEFAGDQIKKGMGMDREIKNINMKAESIEHATGEQRTAMEEIVQSIGRINEISQVISSGSEEIAANTNENANIANILNSKVDYFKIKPEQ